jgi:predicted metal-dependent hydrolase
LDDNVSKKLFFADEFILPTCLASQAKTLFRRWYQEKAKEIIPKRVERCADQYGFIYKKVTITSAQKRWGSCNSRGNVNFSWRLIMVPIEVVDYVIVHELAHLTHLDHSKKFWTKVQSIMPDYKNHKKWLKLNGPLFNI